MEKQYGATFCMVLSAWAVPLLLFFGVLCSQGSPMIELEPEVKKDAAWGCYGSALLYALTFFAAYEYKRRAEGVTSRRDFMQELTSVTGSQRNRRDTHID
mmetsp:Transcript_105057/g.250078  ORF Transcript_105057/g.250078 Transcript_105057/m.250078 type:complete len:100 (+) Transcript_105057:68-367(+)